MISITSTVPNIKRSFLFSYFHFLTSGSPEPPFKINTPVDKLQMDFPIAVNISISWVPGFSGGFPVEFILFYKEKDEFTSSSFESYMIGSALENKFFFTNRKPSTTYEFAMASKNQLGISSRSQSIEFKTRGN